MSLYSHQIINELYKKIEKNCGKNIACGSWTNIYVPPAKSEYPGLQPTSISLLDIIYPPIYTTQDVSIYAEGPLYVTAAPIQNSVIHPYLRAGEYNYEGAYFSPIPKRIEYIESFNNLESIDLIDILCDSKVV